jgi:hypothetical protein
VHEYKAFKVNLKLTEYLINLELAKWYLFRGGKAPTYVSIVVHNYSYCKLFYVYLHKKDRKHKLMGSMHASELTCKT